MVSKSRDKNTRTFDFGLPARPTDEICTRLVKDVGSENLALLGKVCPAVVSTESPRNDKFLVKEIPRSELSKPPGKDFLSKYHQIVLPHKSPEQIEYDLTMINYIVKVCEISPLLATILYGRGYKTFQEVDEFLNPSIERELAKLPDYINAKEKDPELMPPIGKAGWRMVEGIRRGERILLAGDYDADGNTSLAILATAFKAFGVEIMTLQPDREVNGYGATDSFTEKILKHKPNLVVFLDFGTNNKPQIRRLRELGIDTIVADHHECLPERLSNPNILIWPRGNPTWHGYIDLCTAGLAYFCAQSMFAHGRDLLDLRHEKIEEFLAKLSDDLLGFLAIGTFGDCCPLIGLVRAMTHKGVQAIKRSELPIFRLLTQLSQKSGMTGQFLNFSVVPVLNASGRVNPQKGDEPGTAPTLKALLATDMAQARLLWAELESHNRHRKELESSGWLKVKAAVYQQMKEGIPVQCGVAVAIEGAHPAIAGILAAKLVARLGAPAIVLVKDSEGDWTGSGRSIEGVSLIDLLHNKAFEGLTKSFGGHALAVGIKVANKQIKPFLLTFNEVGQVVSQVKPCYPDPFTEIPSQTDHLKRRTSHVTQYSPDVAMTIAEIIAQKESAANDFMKLEPCGKGNPAVSILVPSCRRFSESTVSKATVGNQSSETGHIRLILQDGHPLPNKPLSLVDAIAFEKRIAPELLSKIERDQLIDILVQPSFDRATDHLRSDLKVNFQIEIAQPAVFEVPTLKKNKEKRSAAPEFSKPPRQPELDDHLVTFPKMSSFAEAYSFLGIDCLSDLQLEFRKAQMDFVIEQCLRMELGGPPNLLYRANTGGGKTLMSFIFAARVLSKDPKAKVVFLVPVTNVVEQTYNIALKRFNKFKVEEFVKLEGYTPEQRRKLYEGPGRLFFCTPQIIENDQSLKYFSLGLLDEGHYLKGDSSYREPSKYAFRNVVAQAVKLQKASHPLRLIIQSATPAPTDTEVKLKVSTSHSRWAAVNLPTGKNKWQGIEVRLPEEHRNSILQTRDAYRNCYLELTKVFPPWLKIGASREDISPSEFKLVLAVNALEKAHSGIGISRSVPSDSKLRAVCEFIFHALVAIEKDQKASVNKDQQKLIRNIRIKLHELALIRKWFEEFKTKGRKAFVRVVTHDMLKSLYPENKDKEPVLASPFSTIVRALRRPQMRSAIEWSFRESSSRAVLCEFDRVFGKSTIFSNARGSINAVPKAFHEVLGSTSSADNADSVNRLTKYGELLDQYLYKDFLNSKDFEPKELAFIKSVKESPSDFRHLLRREELFEVRLFSEQLVKMGIAASWYAGNSVKKSFNVDANREAYNSGIINVLVSTSAIDIGADLARTDRTYRFEPVISAIANNQFKGRGARSVGSTGTYSPLLNKDADPDLDESHKLYIAKTLERRMERIGTK